MTLNPGLTLREAADTDAPALAALQGEVWPQHTTTAEALLHELADLRAHPLRPHVWRLVAEEAGEVVGLASVHQFPGMFHPDRYHADLLVRPAAQGRGVGRALAAALEAHLDARPAREVLAGTQEDHPRGLAFLARHGFREAMRFFDNVLDLRAFDPAPWAEAARLPEGLRLLSLPELIAEQGEDAAWRAYHAAAVEAREDVPRTGEATPLLYGAFRTRGEHPQFLPAGVLLAVTASGEVAALTELYADAADPARLNTGLTGTRRACRRQGLALSLKLAALDLARRRGAQSIWTGNATTNVPMLTLNERLGFRPRPAWTEMKRGEV
ncbi:N-acetyltransferase GCN5 [Deinococcus phoenicis]|uniref:N-acetyltransferase GCN5 n=1 Tax=Deinococcus phoenicis TaxID=1476583 RepID=A0A016QNF6_9DEIO|nr:GNAT family N-acetyltransferase [Deinococcus phoenicis]EYB67578.1 N-acetyltransferase GCN5 [Deinococcus phoenicis]